MPVAPIAGGLKYETKGNPEDPALLFVAGLGAGINSWMLLKFVYNILNVRAKRWLIMYDPRGTYDNPPVPDYPFEAMVTDARDLLDHLGVQRADVLGWSMGGAVAQMFAVMYPERLNKLALLATVPMGPRDDPELAPLFAAMGEMMGGMTEEPTPEQMQQMMDIISEYSFNSGLFQTIMGLMMDLSPLLAPGMFDGIVQQMKAMINLNSWDRLHQIQAPTCVMHGTEDALIPFLAAELLVSRIPGAQLVAGDGWCHAAAMENVFAVNKALRRFLRRGRR